MRRAGLTARKSLDPASCRVCSTRPGSYGHSAQGFGQQVASLVLWFGLDDWVTDQINMEVTRTFPGDLHTYIQTLDNAHNGQAHGLNLRHGQEGRKRTVNINDEQTDGFQS